MTVKTMNADPDCSSESNPSASVSLDSTHAAGYHPAYSNTDSGFAAGARGLEMDTTRVLVEQRKQIQGLTIQNAEAKKSINELQRQLDEATRQASEARRLVKQLTALNQFHADLQNTPDAEHAARRLVRLIHQQVHSDLVYVFTFQAVEQRFKLMASSGTASNTFQPNQTHPVFVQAVEERRVAATLPDAGPLPMLQAGGKSYGSYIIVPLVQHNEVVGLVGVASQASGAFQAGDSTFIENASAQFLTVWGYALRTEALTEFIHAITRLSYVTETGSLMERIATIARQTLQARYALVAIRNRKGWLMRDSGYAPHLFASIQKHASMFLNEAGKAPHTIRLKDVCQEERARGLEIDQPELKSLLFSPILTDGETTGLLVVFGKHGNGGFTEQDVRMAELLATRAAVNLKSCYLNDEILKKNEALKLSNRELEENLRITQLLYGWSQQIAKADNMSSAAWVIASTAYRLYRAQRCGLVLYNPVDQSTEADVCLPGKEDSSVQPEALIQQAMNTRKTVYAAGQDEASFLVIPIQSRRLSYGALWMEFIDRGESGEHPTEEIRILVNQAAVAVERMFLLQETRSQAQKLEDSNARLQHALSELELAYDQTIGALMRALDARDRDTEDHSTRVTHLSVWLGAHLGLGQDELRSLRRGAMLHDLGKIGIRDYVLLKKDKLSPMQWKQMRTHPEKGVEIIKEIPHLSDAIPVIICHHERWNGSGYPKRLKGTEIPLVARIFAVIDVYDALTSDRPYRKKLPKAEVLEYLDTRAGIDFDPEIVTIFTSLMRADPPPYEIDPRD